MADYYTRFCCRLDVGTAEDAAHALALYEAMAGAAYVEDDGAIGFEAVLDATSPSALVMQDGNGFGEPESVAAYVLRCAEAFALQGRWGFAWAHTCSRARLDGFGGGALVLDLGTRETVARVDCDEWLARQLAGGGRRPPCPGAAPAEAVTRLLLALPAERRGTILREAGGAAGWHVLALLDEASVREEVRELAEAYGEVVAVQEAEVSEADIRDACRRMADGVQLSDQVGEARFRAAGIAIRAAEARRGRAPAPASG